MTKPLNKNLPLIILFMLFVTFISCKKDIKTNIDSNKSMENNELKEYLNFYFPDTVYIKNVYEGVINYKSELDTITPDFFVIGDTMRILSFYLQDNKNQIPNNFDHILKSKRIDTFYSLTDDGEILFTHKFKKLGINYLEGVLVDEVLIDEADTLGLRIITKYNHITLPVLVTDNDSIMDSFVKEDIKARVFDKSKIIQNKI